MLLGIDYGAKKIGISYSEGIHASPLAVITNNPKTRIAQLSEHIKCNVEKIIIGLPNSPYKDDIYRFGNELKVHYDCDIVYSDEFNSTQEAKALMIGADVSKHKRRSDDAQAAVIILNRFLEESEQSEK